MKRNKRYSNLLRLASLLVAISLLFGCAQAALPKDETPPMLTAHGETVTGKNGVLTGFQLLTETPTAGERLELAVDIPAAAEGLNLYREDAVDITVTFTAENGKTLVTDAFYYEDYAFAADHALMGRSEQEPCFRVRLTPPDGGRWNVTAVLRLNGEEVDSLAAGVEVAASSKGSRLLQVEPARRQTFVTAAGQNTVMIGENLAWSYPTLRAGSFAQYAVPIMEQLAANGGNYVRIWDYMDCVNRIKAGVHQMNQNASAMWDRVFEQAEELGVYVSFVLMNHGEVSTMVDARWTSSIFHANQGGYITEAKDFFSDRNTIDAFKTYCRYIVSRWGYSENVMTWELFNEIDHTDGATFSLYTDLRNWLTEITEYLRSIDPYGHMVSNSTGDAGNQLAGFEIFDFTYLHVYDPDDLSSLARQQRMNWKAYGRPVLMGECAMIREMRGFLSEDLTFLHQANWAGVMGGGAGTGMNFFWNNLPENGYRLYRPVSDMAARIPWHDPALIPATSTEVWAEHEQCNGIGYVGETCAYLWFYDTGYWYDTRIETAFENETVSLAVSDGTYAVTWYDTRTGACVLEQTAAAENGTLTLRMPPWRKDIAVTVEKR